MKNIAIAAIGLGALALSACAPTYHDRYVSDRYYQPRDGYAYSERDRNSYADRDRDGVPNRYDRDRDNDGVPNSVDRRPNNPYRD